MQKIRNDYMVCSWTPLNYGEDRNEHMSLLRNVYGLVKTENSDPTEAYEAWFEYHNEAKLHLMMKDVGPHCARIYYKRTLAALYKYQHEVERYKRNLKRERPWAWDY